jgi:hypothetical protein
MLAGAARVDPAKIADASLELFGIGPDKQA